MDALVAYGSDSEEEEEKRQRMESEGSEEQQNARSAAQQDDLIAPLVEPRPPRRQSDMFDDDSDIDEKAADRGPDASSSTTGEREAEGEEELDSLLDKGLSASKLTDVATGGGSTPGPGYTPRSGCSTDEQQLMMMMELEAEGEQDSSSKREVPPSPPGECDSELERRFSAFFDKKERGIDMNANIKRRKDYKNPSLYETLRDTYGIDEKGTNFGKSVYDPSAFRPDDFHDALGDYQAGLEARRKKMAQQQEQQHHHKRPASFPTATTTAAAGERRK